MKYMLAVDLETTGLNPRHHEITQIGAILLDRELKELGEFETLVKIDYPERGLEGGFDVFKYTGITQDSLKDAPTLKKSLRAMEVFVRSKIGGFSLESVAVFGQNPRFDVGFLEEAYRSLGWKFPFDFHVIGLESAYVFYSLKKNGTLPVGLRLKDICKKAGIKNAQEHNAIADIRATVDSLRALLEK